MSQPAARATDAHACPIHGAGAIAPTPGRTVLIKMLPAACVTDVCVCAGPPNAIAVGSLNVIINRLCAARVGDPTVHAGAVTMGELTVLIGQVGNPIEAMAQAVNPSASVINCGFIIDAAIDRIFGTNPASVAPAGQDGTFTQIGARHGSPLQWGNTLDGAFDAVRSGGPGTTAIVGIDYGNGSSHVVVMTNHYGTPVIVEGQNWGAGQPAEAISRPADAATRYSPHDVGIAVLPNKAPVP